MSTIKDPAAEQAALAALRAAIDKLPAINTSRVMALHQRIMAGEYRGDSLKTAEKILALEAELNRPRPSTGRRVDSGAGRGVDRGAGRRTR